MKEYHFYVQKQFDDYNLFGMFQQPAEYKRIPFYHFLSEPS